mgnify:CR=1 FL=1
MLRRITQVLVIALAGAAILQTVSRAEEHGANLSSADLTLADLMSIMQSRHLKLGYAALAKNWPLARYELSLMQQSFDAAAQRFPTVGSVPLGDLVKTISTPALAEIGQAVEKRDETKFFAAFKKLTSACNSCHEESQVGFVIIRPPTSSPFSNQNFEPSSK